MYETSVQTEVLFETSCRVQEQRVRGTQRPWLSISSTHISIFVVLRMLDILAIIDSFDVKK